MESNKKSKLTLIVDGNWLLMSRLFVLSNRYAQDDELVKEMQLLMLHSISLVLRTFPDIDNLIFVTDGGSWRNKLPIPSFMQDEYKGNREPNPDINWELIFGGYEDLRNKLSETGINVCWESGVEGDDWCWYWSKELNADGTNVIIWSKDKDLTQLVHTDKNKCFTVCWSKEGGVVCEDVDEDDMDFLFNQSFNDNEQIYNNVVKKSKVVNKINPKHVVIDKIIRGDAGDNIFPIIQKPASATAKNPDKLFRVTQKEIDDTLDFMDDGCIIDYITNLLSKKSYSKVTKPLNDILEHFHYNTRLVYLDETSYPQDILVSMKMNDSYICNKDISIAESQIKAQKADIENILETI